MNRMDAHNTVEERVRDALRYRSELPNIEFKRGASFSDLQYHIAKTAQAIANLRDGGLIIVGVAQTDKEYALEGVTPEHEASYQVEAVYDFVNSYASPSMELRVLTVDFEGNRFVAVAIPPFERLPIVCRKNTPSGAAREMRAGEVYVRTGAPVGTTKVTSAAMMEELLQRASAFRAAETLRILRSGGVQMESLVPPDPLQKEVEDLADLL